MSTTLGIWVGAVLTLAILSFLHKENPFYSAAEHVFVGVSAGYGVIVSLNSYVYPTLKDISKGQMVLLVPVVIGLLIYTRYFKPVAWASHVTLSFLIGIGSGVILTRTLKPFFVDQITATIIPLWVPGSLGQSLNNLMFIAGVVGTLSYFFFTTEHKGLLGASSTWGRWVMMVAFGAAFGNTVMARISLFLGRLQFLMTDWLHILQ